MPTILVHGAYAREKDDIERPSFLWDFDPKRVTWKRMQHRQIGVVLGVALASTGCFLSPIPDMRTPADHARELDVRCRTFSDQASAPALTPAGVDTVEADYAHVPTGNASEQRLQGAKLHLRPLAGTTV